MKKFIGIILLLVSSAVYSQDKIQIDESDYANDNVEMADTLRSEGKIYVVVGVILVILVVLIGYVVKADRAVTRLEKRLSNDDQNHNA